MIVFALCVCVCVVCLCVRSCSCVCEGGGVLRLGIVHPCESVFVGVCVVGWGADTAECVYVHVCVWGDWEGAALLWEEV